MEVYFDDGYTSVMREVDDVLLFVDGAFLRMTPNQARELAQVLYEAADDVDIRNTKGE